MVIWNRTPFSPYTASPMGLARQAEALMGLFNHPAQAERGPAVSLQVGDDQVTVLAQVPGHGPEDLDIQLEGVFLHIASQAQDTGQMRQAFRRSLRMPFRLDPDSVEATLQHGELTITAQRHAADAPREVQIRPLDD